MLPLKLLAVNIGQSGSGSVYTGDMPNIKSLAVKQKYFGLLSQGMSQKDAAAACHIDTQTGRKWERGAKTASGIDVRAANAQLKLPGPVRKDQLSGAPKRALDDFGFWRLRYMGRRASPWQESAAEKFVQYLDTDGRDFVVLNCPPGAGKSTLLSDIELWLTCRNRAIRGLVGSSTAPKAVRDCKKLRRVFERVTPIKAKPDDLARGVAFDATAVLAKDYGRFQPITQDTWRAEQFIVAQWDDTEITEKEATWMAFGIDSDFLGTRVDIAVWDDAVTKKDLLTMEAMSRIRDIWDDEIETRLEPDGALFLVGQRLGTEDLYAHCLNKVADDDNDYWEQFEDPANAELIDNQHFIDPEGSQDALPKMYHHIVYPAHAEDAETHDHSKGAKQWPEGCLLEPRRLPWTFLRQVASNNKEKYDTVYQQKDAQPPDALVKRIWIEGGMEGGVEYPGCYDREREVGEVPKLMGKNYSVISVDPSGTQRWGLIWAIYSPEGERRHVIYAKGKKMKASDLIDWNFEQGIFTGILEDWYIESVQKGVPITHVIIEKNDAQVYISQFSIFNKWKSERGIHYVPHGTTGINKNSTELGVTAIGSHFEFGRWRLPGHGLWAIRDTSEFVNELVNYSSESKYRSDMVMAAWFIEMWISKMAKPDAGTWPTKQTPRWIRQQPSSNGLRIVS